MKMHNFYSISFALHLFHKTLYISFILLCQSYRNSLQTHTRSLKRHFEIDVECADVAVAFYALFPSVGYVLGGCVVTERFQVYLKRVSSYSVF